MQISIIHANACACRAYGRFNLSLWDDVMAEFQPLTEEDVIVVNFGAWYPRYNIYESGYAAHILTAPLNAHLLLK